MLPWSAAASSKELLGGCSPLSVWRGIGASLSSPASLFYWVQPGARTGIRRHPCSCPPSPVQLGNDWEERSPRPLLLSVLSPPREMLLRPHSRVQVFEGAEDNLPDRDSLRAALAIRQLAEGLTADDLLLVLISGAGARLAGERWGGRGNIRPSRGHWSEPPGDTKQGSQ